MNGLAKLRLFIELKENLNKGLDAAHKKITKATGGIQSKLDSFKAKNIQAFDAITDKVPGVGGAVKALVNPYTLIIGAAVSFATAAGIATTRALEWRDAMAQINVTAENSPEKLQKLSDKLLKIGANNVATLFDVPKGFGVLIGGLNDEKKALDALEPTLRAAKAGYTDIQTTAEAGTRIMESSGVDATQAYDVLFATVKAGNAEFRDLANYLPKVVPLAQNVGFKLEETAGAMAYLTKSLKPEAAATALEGMMRAMSNENVVKNFKKIKVDIFDVKTGQARPVVDILTDLETSMSGLTDKQRMLKFESLGLDQSGALGFSKMIQNLDQVKKDIGDVVGSAGALEKAYENAKTPLDSWKIIQNKIMYGMIKIGEIFLPIIGKIGEGILSLFKFLREFSPVIIGIAGAIALLNVKIIIQSAIWLGLKAAIAATTAAQWLFNVAMSANPIGIVVVLIGALIGGLVMAYKRFDKVRAVVQGSWGVIKGFGDILKEYVIDRITEIISGLGALGSAIGKLFKGDFSGAWDDAKKGVYALSGMESKTKAIDSTLQLKHTFNNTYAKVLADAVKKNAVGETDPEGTTDNIVKPNPIVPANPEDDIHSIKNGSQTKNTTINIDSFVKGFNPTHQSINSMSKDELERWMTEMFLRVVRSAETAI